MMQHLCPLFSSTRVVLIFLQPPLSTVPLEGHQEVSGICDIAMICLAVHKINNSCVNFRDRVYMLICYLVSIVHIIKSVHGYRNKAIIIQRNVGN